MKPVRSLIITLLACTLLFSGCKKSNPGPTYQIAFTFNGTSYDMQNPAIAVNTNGLLTSIGKSGNANVALQFFDAAVGTIAFNQGATLIFETSSLADDVYTCSSGSFTVTNFSSTNISGTFDVMVIHIDEDAPLPVKGSFNIKIQ